MLGKSIVGPGRPAEARRATIYSLTFLPLPNETKKVRQRIGRPARSCNLFAFSAKRALSSLKHGEVSKHVSLEEPVGLAFHPELLEPVRSTLTPAEQAVFARIGDDAAKRHAQYVRSEEGAIERLIKDENHKLTADLSLDVLFKKTRATTTRSFIARARSFLKNNLVEADSMEAVFFKPLSKNLSISSARRSNIPSDINGLNQPSTQREHGPAISLEIETEPETPSDQMSPAQEERRRSSADSLIDQIQFVQNCLENATSDHEIWETLHKRVFSQVQHLNDSKDVEDPKQQVSVKEKRGRKIDRKNAYMSNDSNLANAGNVSHRIQIDYQTPQTFTTMQASYAYHCWTALRRLREHFPQSPYATAILPTIKSLGPKSYVLVVSTELYNEALFINWIHYRNPNACADIRAEMLDRGIPSNSLTLAVFRDAACRWLEVRKISKTKNTKQQKTASLPRTGGIQNSAAFLGTNESMSAFEVAWWKLEGIRMGYRRWQMLEIEARERREEDRRQEEEARKEAEMDDSEPENVAIETI